MTSPSTHSERGMALIGVLGLLVAVIAIATALLTSQHSAGQRMHYFERDIQAEMIAEGVRTWLGAKLMQDPLFAEPTQQAVSMRDYPLAPEGVKVELELRDLQSYLNVNALASNDPGVIKAMRGLIAEKTKSPALFGEMLDWIDGDNAISTIEGMTGSPLDDGESAAYKSKNLSYTPANAAFHDRSELWLLPSMTSEAFQALAPYITVLPPDAESNIATMEESLLALLSDNSRASEIVKARTLRTLTASDAGSVAAGMTRITADSHYYGARIRVHLGDFSRIYSAIFMRSQEVNQTPSTDAPKWKTVTLRWAEGETLF